MYSIYYDLGMISCQGLHLDINEKRVSLQNDPLGSPPPSICPKVCVTEFNLYISAISTWWISHLMIDSYYLVPLTKQS